MQKLEFECWGRRTEYLKITKKSLFEFSRKKQYFLIVSNHFNIENETF